MSTVESDLLGIGNNSGVNVPQISVTICLFGYELAKFGRYNPKNMTRRSDHHKRKQWSYISILWLRILFSNKIIIYKVSPITMLAFIFCDDRMSAYPIIIRSKQGFVSELYKCATELANVEISSVKL